MSTAEPNLDTMLTDQPDDSPGMKEVRAALRRAQERTTQLEADAAAAAVTNKENAFLKAGISVNTATTSPVAQFLYDNYVGELTAEAITAKATELGIAPVAGAQPPSNPTDPAATAPPPSTPATPPVDPTQTQQRNALAGEPVPTSELPSSNPVEQGYQAFHADLAQGAVREDAAAAVLSQIIGAANAGDDRFIFRPEAWANQPGASDR